MYSANPRDTTHSLHELEKAVEALLHAGGFRGHNGWRTGEKLVQRLLVPEIEFFTALATVMTPETKRVFTRSLVVLASSGKYRRRDSSLNHAVYLAANVSPILADCYEAGMADSVDAADASIHAATSLRWCREKRMPEDMASRDHAVVQGQMFEWLLEQWATQKSTASSDKDYYRWLSAHRGDVLRLKEQWMERGSVRPDLLRSLVDNASLSLSSGVL